MSHFAKYAVAVTNIEYAKQALTEMGYGYEENGIVRTQFGESRAAELVVLREGRPISLGLCRNEETNELELVADWWGLRIPQNEFTTQLSQLHAKYQVFDICEQNQWTVDQDSIQYNEEGELELTASRFA